MSEVLSPFFAGKRGACQAPNDDVFHHVEVFCSVLDVFFVCPISQKRTSGDFTPCHLPSSFPGSGTRSE